MASNPMTCASLLSVLCEYVDGELDQAACAEIERHLAECEHCRILVDTTRKTISLAQACTDSETQLPEEVRERLFRRLDLPGHPTRRQSD